MGIWSALEPTSSGQWKNYNMYFLDGLQVGWLLFGPNIVISSIATEVTSEAEARTTRALLGPPGCWLNIVAYLILPPSIQELQDDTA